MTSQTRVHASWSLQAKNAELPVLGEVHSLQPTAVILKIKSSVAGRLFQLLPNCVFLKH